MNNTKGLSLRGNSSRYSILIIKVLKINSRKDNQYVMNT